MIHYFRPSYGYGSGGSGVVEYWLTDRDNSMTRSVPTMKPFQFVRVAPDSVDNADASMEVRLIHPTSIVYRSRPPHATHYGNPTSTIHIIPGSSDETEFPMQNCQADIGTSTIFRPQNDHVPSAKRYGWEPLPANNYLWACSFGSFWTDAKPDCIGWCLFDMPIVMIMDVIGSILPLELCNMITWDYLQNENWLYKETNENQTKTNNETKTGETDEPKELYDDGLSGLAQYFSKKIQQSKNTRNATASANNETETDEPRESYDDIPLEQLSQYISKKIQSNNTRNTTTSASSSSSSSSSSSVED